MWYMEHRDQKGKKERQEFSCGHRCIIGSLDVFRPDFRKSQEHGLLTAEPPLDLSTRFIPSSLKAMFIGYMKLAAPISGAVSNIIRYSWTSLQRALKAALRWVFEDLGLFGPMENAVHCLSGKLEQLIT